MSNEIQSWEEWNGLTEDQRDYSLYTILKALTQKLSEQDEKYQIRFRKLEKRKALNTVESLTGGIIGGILAILGKGQG